MIGVVTLEDHYCVGFPGFAYEDAYRITRGGRPFEAASICTGSNRQPK